VVAAMAAAAAAFAYNDLTPMLGAVTAEKLAPAQDAIRAASTVVGTCTWTKTSSTCVANCTCVMCGCLTMCLRRVTNRCGVCCMLYAVW